MSDPRHDCQERDGLDSYEYTQHDGRSAAVQVIKDSRNNVALTLSLLKVPGGDMGPSTVFGPPESYDQL